MKKLTKQEQLLFTALKESAVNGRSVSREDLYKAMYPDLALALINTQSRTLDVYIGYLRRKTGKQIVAVRGFGYKLILY